jgi:zinc/manganese transport system ATP-binding protein
MTLDVDSATSLTGEHAGGAARGAAGTATARTAARAAVELRGAEVRLNDRVQWSGVDLKVVPGEFLAVLGPNGVGKTTLLRVILGQLPVSAGEVLVLGKPAGQENHRIGYLPQRRSFEAGLRIRGVDLVRLGLDGDRWGLPVPGLRFVSERRRAEDAHVRDVIELVGASAYAERSIGEISGGEQQRLLIAQALVRDPALLLLDEPLNGLDLPSQAGITALIGEISREQDIAVVMVAHDVNPLLGYLDQAAYVGDGHIVAGPPEQVITTETLSRLYGTTVEVVHTADGRLAVLGQPEVHATCHGSGC